MAEFTIKADIRGIYYENGKLYMILPWIHAIVTYDFQTKKVGTLECDCLRDNTFDRILKYGDRLYLFPALGNGIYYYDIRNREYKNILWFDSIKDDVDFSNRTFFEVFEYEQLIYAVCRCPNVVICIDPADDAVQVYYLSEKLLKRNLMIKEYFPVCIYGEKLVYAYSSDIVIEFSLADKEFYIVYLKGEKDNYEEENTYLLYGMLLNDSGDKWLYNLYGDLFRMVGNKKIRVKMPEEMMGVYDDGFTMEQYKINHVIFEKNRLYFIPQFEHRILIYDIKANTFTWCENSYADWKESRRMLAYTVCAKINATSYLLYHYNNSAIYVWDMEKGFTDKIELKLSVGELVDNVAFNEYALHYFAQEDDLEFYLAYVGKAVKYRDNIEVKYCGTRIYQSIEG